LAENKKYMFLSRQNRMKTETIVPQVAAATTEAVIGGGGREGGGESAIY